MATITTINGTDSITSSRTVINTNLSNLNSDKIETSYLDTDTTLAANSDVKIATQKAVKAYVDSGGNTLASTTNKGIVEEATDAEVVARTAAGGTGARLYINPASLSSIAKSGGTGADGALSISSGTTTIDLAGARTTIKNYTSISITGTGALAFINPHASGSFVALKSQGNVTITSSATRAIDVRSLGGNFGAGGLTIDQDGASGTVGFSTIGTAGAGTGGSASGATGGTAGAAQSPTFFTAAILPKNIYFIAGAGGGGGEASNVGGAAHSSGGDGGRGGGALYIECAGSYSASGTIDASGGAGSNGASGSNRGGGGGGGGGGGSIVVLYTTLTSNTGTYTVAGGTAGSGGTGSGGGANAGAGGAGGGSMTGGAAGSSASGNTGGAGGAGGNGYSIVAANVDFF